MFGKKKRQIHNLMREVAELKQQRDHEWNRANWFDEFFKQHGGTSVWNAEQELEELKDQETQLTKNIERLRRQTAELRTLTDFLKAEKVTLEAGLDTPPHPAEDSIALQSQLRTLRQEISTKVKSSKAVFGADHFEVPTAKAQVSKLGKDIGKLALRAFNAEADNAVKGATATNFETSASKIFRSANAVEKLGATAGVQIDPDYIELRVRELRLAVEHLEAKKLERELERERRQELREQAEAERELEAERKRIEKEKLHYLNVLKTVEKLGDTAETEKIKAEIISLEKSINDIEAREANARAGYVYVISNIGSFGERMVKIGMTRRLNPMDRVKELSDASVPFNFDVHALFFSEDAVGVETALHQQFADRKANLLNPRREFFLVTPLEVKDALLQIEGTLLEFTEYPEADQYRQTLAMRESNEQTEQ